MHFLTCLLLGILLLAEGNTELSVSPARVVLAITLVTLSPILLAWLQGVELVRNRRLAGPQPELESRALRQADVIHFSAWACASLAGVWLMQWPTLIKSTLGLSDWLLVDELLLIAPATFSLVVSWLVFESTTRPEESRGKMGSEPAASVFEQLLHRFPATVFKLQHSLGLVLLPLLLLFAIRDLGSGQNGSAASTLMAGIAGLVCVVLLYPFYLRFVLPSRPLQPEGELSQYTGWRIRNWNTGETVYNALVTGLLPGFQTVFVSDGLLKHFPSSEVAAIVGHEVAHARRGHLLLRAIAITGPLLILLGLWVSGLNAVEPLMNSINRMEPTGLVALVAIVAGWAWGVIRPLSHWIEFDADRAAILDPETGKPNPARLNALNSALLRLGYAFPDQFTRRTLLHPSLEQRLGRLNGIRGEIQS